MKTLIALLAITLPLFGQEIIIKPAEGEGEAVKVDVSGPAKIALGGRAYHIELVDKAATQIKAEKITIPFMSLEDTHVLDAIEFLRSRSIELDSLTLDPALKGINFATKGEFPKRIDDLRVRNISLHEALRLITLKVGASVEYREKVVMVIGEPEKTHAQNLAESVNLPSLNLKNTSVEDAVMFLNNRRDEIHDVDGKPIIPNIVTHGKFVKHIDELRVRNITIHEALELIALKADAKLKYKDSVAIIIGKE